MTSGRSDEVELIRSAAEGDDDAFRLLVRRVHPRLRRWALARTGDPDDADEVVQRTLIRMHRGLGRFHGGSRVSSWLYRILANAATDVAREHTRNAARRESARRESARAHGAPAGPRPDPVAALYAGRMAAVVRDFLTALPTGQREVIELVDHQGMRPVEVAEALGMKPVTVRAQLFKARRALRSRILERYPELTEGYDR